MWERGSTGNTTRPLCLGCGFVALDQEHMVVDGASAPHFHSLSCLPDPHTCTVGGRELYGGAWTELPTSVSSSRLRTGASHGDYLRARKVNRLNQANPMMT